MSGTDNRYRETKLMMDEDGHPMLCVPQSAAPGKEPIDINAYIQSLNDPEFANSDINPQGAVTDPNCCICISIDSEAKTYGFIIGHEFNPFVYRGENKDYEEFIPSALRYKGNKDEKFCIEIIKECEFKTFFWSLPYYSRCQKFKVLGYHFEFDLQAIQQHYGLISRYIDISQDEEIAKFFAYTYQKDGEYFPITDFRDYSPTLYRGNLSKIHAGGLNNRLKFIGFQGLLRPFKQKAMAIDAPRGSKLKSLFEKIELPKDPEIARRIFRKYKHGKALFPKRDYFGEIVRKFQKNRCLSRKFFNEYCGSENLIADPVELEKKINAAGYILTDTDGIPEYDAVRLDKELDKNLISFYEIVRYRLGSRQRINTDFPESGESHKPIEPRDPGTSSRQE